MPADKCDFGSLISQDLVRNTGRTGLVAATAMWFLSPSFRLLSTYRAAVYLRPKALGRLCSALLLRAAIRDTGCFISVKARIGPGLHLPHATGVVIGEGARIGRNVTIYQHVTLGRSTIDGEDYPNIDDGVVIFAGAVIVGGVTIGRNAVVGANSVVTRDVEPGATVAGVPARVLKVAG